MIDTLRTVKYYKISELDTHAGEFSVLDKELNTRVCVNNNIESMRTLKYYAISHTWKTRGEKEVEVDVADTKILMGCGSKAATLLRIASIPHLRFWLDKLIIPNDDSDKVAQQVSIMDKIYENAEATIVLLSAEEWLIFKSENTQREPLVREYTTLIGLLHGLTDFVVSYEDEEVHLYDLFNEGIRQARARSKELLEWIESSKDLGETVERISNLFNIALALLADYKNDRHRLFHVATASVAMEYNSRCWTLQERVLAHRILFAHGEYCVRGDEWIKDATITDIVVVMCLATLTTTLSDEIILRSYLDDAELIVGIQTMHIECTRVIAETSDSYSLLLANIGCGCDIRNSRGETNTPISKADYFRFLMRQQRQCTVLKDRIHSMYKIFFPEVDIPYNIDPHQQVRMLNIQLFKHGICTSENYGVNEGQCWSTVKYDLKDPILSWSDTKADWMGNNVTSITGMLSKPVYDVFEDKFSKMRQIQLEKVTDNSDTIGFRAFVVRDGIIRFKCGSCEVRLFTDDIFDLIQEDDNKYVKYVQYVRVFNGDLVLRCSKRFDSDILHIESVRSVSKIYDGVRVLYKGESVSAKLNDLDNVTLEHYPNVSSTGAILDAYFREVYNEIQNNKHDIDVEEYLTYVEVAGVLESTNT